jgi:hypothetical protein
MVTGFFPFNVSFTFFRCVFMLMSTPAHTCKQWRCVFSLVYQVPVVCLDWSFSRKGSEQVELIDHRGSSPCRNHNQPGHAA